MLLGSLVFVRFCSDTRPRPNSTGSFPGLHNQLLPTRLLQFCAPALQRFGLKTTLEVSISFYPTTYLVANQQNVTGHQIVPYLSRNSAAHEFLIQLHSTRPTNWAKNSEYGGRGRNYIPYMEIYPVSVPFFIDETTPFESRLYVSSSSAKQ